MAVISNTSPLNYLILTGYDHVLPALFASVVIPEAVARELSSDRAPPVVLQWMSSLPAWISVRSIPTLPADLHSLDQGEAEAIALAVATGAELVLLDERRGRRAARERQLNVAGTIGVLDAAATRGLIRFSDALDALVRTSFRISPRYLRELRSRA
jgi:predicted nucleic acid-binding protein